MVLAAIQGLIGLVFFSNNTFALATNPWFTSNIDYYTAATKRSDGSLGVLLATWTRISWATNGSTFKTYIDGVQDISNSSTVDEVAVGSIGVCASNTADLYFDDCVWDNTSSTDDIGDVRVQLAQPNAAGTYTQFATAVPSGTHYTTYDDNPGSISDSDYVQEPNKSALRDTAGLESCSDAGLVGTDTINAVQIWARMSGDNVDPTSGITVRDNGTNYETLSVMADDALPAAWVSKMYATNAPRGSAWTQAIFDSLEAGAYHGGDSDDTFLTVLMAMIAYTVASSPDPDISLDISSYDYGVVANSSTNNTGLDYFTITNNSGFAVDLSIKATDFTGGVGWTLSDTATAGVNTAGLKAGLFGGSYNIIVKKTAPYNDLDTSVADSGTVEFGLQLLAPTGVTDGVQKTTIVTVTATAS